MAGFVQIIEHKTQRFDEMQQLQRDFEEKMKASGRDTPISRIAVTKDRDRDDTYLVIVEFDSYEAAMANSNLPETGDFSEQMMKLADGPPTFYNLDVVSTAEPR